MSRRSSRERRKSAARARKSAARAWKSAARARKSAARARAQSLARRVMGALSAMGTGMVLRAGPVLAQVTLTPDSSQGPGGPQAQQLVNWIAGLALIACVAALVFHAVGWGWGSQQHNLARVQDGKAGVVRAALVAGVIAAAAALVNFAAGLGGAVK